MKKRLSCMILTLAMIFCLVPYSAAVSDEATEAAEALYELGLFKGTGTNPDGTPIFDLDKTPTRNQAIIMLVRLLGKEEEATAGTWDIPFTDVSDSMKPYIGYAYTNGLTNGTSATTYSGTKLIRANQYITFLLRALGYASGEDFTVTNPYTLAQEIGLTELTANPPTFSRGTVAVLSRQALDCNIKGESLTLFEKLGLLMPSKPVQKDTPQIVEDADQNYVQSVSGIVADNGQTFDSVHIKFFVANGDVCVSALGFPLRTFDVNGSVDLYISYDDMTLLLAYATRNYLTGPNRNPYQPDIISLPNIYTTKNVNGKTVRDFEFYQETYWTEYVDANTAYRYTEYKYDDITFTAYRNEYDQENTLSLVYCDGIRTVNGIYYNLKDVLLRFGNRNEPIVTCSGERDSMWYTVFATLDLESK